MTSACCQCLMYCLNGAEEEPVRQSREREITGRDERVEREIRKMVLQYFLQIAEQRSLLGQIRSFFHDAETVVVNRTFFANR